MIIFSALRIQPAIFDQASWVDNTKAVKQPDKVQRMTGNEDGHAEFVAEALDHLTEFDSDRIDTSLMVRPNEEVGFGE